MDESELDPGLKKALVAYFEGFELVELLDVPIEVIVEALEEYIIEEQAQLAEYIRYNDEGEEDDREDD